MTSQGIQLFETDDEEAARLAKAPAGSLSHCLSLLPVTHPYPARHHLIELPARMTRPCSDSSVRRGKHECNGGHRIVVLPLERHAGSAAASLPSRHNGSWDCRIVASDHPIYPVGGYDICCSESELRRGRIVEV